jgi:hypothetical protein
VGGGLLELGADPVDRQADEVEHLLEDVLDLEASGLASAVTMQRYMVM